METSELLLKVFGKDVKIVAPLIGGMMNQSYIVSSKGKKYVLYLPTAQANEMVDRKLEKDNQKIVIGLGITSKNVYFDTDSGIKINEYIEGNSLNNVARFDYAKVAALFRKLHTSPKLCANDYGPFPRFEAYEKETSQYQKEDPSYKELRDVLFSYRPYLEKQKLACCHNDAQKSNIVVTPGDDYYFIDFEFMGNNDPLYDVAAFGNNDVFEGYMLLKAYTGGTPLIDEEKRFYLWRIFLSLQWYDVAITKHYRGEGKAHGYDFLSVADFFLANAKFAYGKLKPLLK